MGLPGLRYLDLVGLRIRSHPFNLYERILKVAPTLTHLRLPMRMAGGLEGALGLGVIVAAPDQQGAEDGELAVAEEQATTTTADTSSNSNAFLELSVPTPYSPTGTHNQLLPTTLQRVYIQTPPASPSPLLSCCIDFSHDREVYTSKMDELRAIESRDERVVVLDWKMEGLRMGDIVKGWDRERGEG
jgi:hypothetical protein